DSSGMLLASYSNGNSQVFGKTSLTSFGIVLGLAQAGGNNWRETIASGVQVIGAPQSGKHRNITGHAQEESNFALTIKLLN
ncbi:flagellar hook protein FlgE, partial [Pseudomonas syringae pv. tagetis]